MSENITYPMEELIPIVAKLSNQYAGYESTSVTFEKAQQFMEAVLYCINELAMPGQEGLAVKELNAGEAYQLGYRLVAEKVNQMRELYNRLIVSFESYGNKCCYDTVVKGIPEFLKWYDVKYNPQNTILTLDYPVLVDLSAYSGIDAVYEFLKCIDLEQKFLHNFDDAYVEVSLNAYSDEHECMIENLCGILLPNVIGHVLLKKPFRQKGFSKEEYDRMAGMLAAYSKSELERILFLIVREIIPKQDGSNKDAVDYFGNAVSDLAVRISHALEFDCPDKLFLL